MGQFSLYLNKTTYLKWNLKLNFNFKHKERAKKPQQIVRDNLVMN